MNAKYRNRHAHDLSNRTFHNWTVLARVASRGDKPRYLCRCVCGVEREVQGQSLTDGISKSCGCLYRKTYDFHRKTYSREYRIWQGMRNRCNNPNSTHYARYGGRGIKVYPLWESSFDAFLHDVGKMPTSLHTLDRIDNDGNYEPGNVRWATRRQQAHNRHDNYSGWTKRQRDELGRFS